MIDRFSFFDHQWLCTRLAGRQNPSFDMRKNSEFTGIVALGSDGADIDSGARDLPRLPVLTLSLS